MKALHILKSNHNLVLSSRRWFDQNKEGKRQDWGQRGTQVRQSRDGGLLVRGRTWDRSEMGNERSETAWFLKLTLISCICLDFQAQALTLKGFLKRRRSNAPQMSGPSIWRCQTMTDDLTKARQKPQTKTDGMVIKFPTIYKAVSLKANNDEIAKRHVTNKVLILF